MTQDVALKEFIYRLQEWRWPEALRGLQSDVLFVTDADIAAALNEAYGPFSCSFATPDRYETSVSNQVKKIVFLCRSGERHLVKRAKAEFPKLEVFSATYDLAPVSLAGGGYFEWSIGEYIQPEFAPIIMLATPGSDADYFRHILSENNVCNVGEYVNRTVAAWASLQEDFEIFRFLSGVTRKHGKKRLQLVIYTDVLFDIFQLTRLTQRRFGNILKDMGVKLVYLTRRDKAVQASLLSQISGELGRSFWSQDHLAQSRINDPEPSQKELDQWLLESMRAEAQLEPMLTQLPKYKNVTLEELVESPQEVVESVAAFLGKDSSADVEWPNYARPYKKRPNLLARSKQYKAGLVDKLGLKLNEYGSYIAGGDVTSG